MPRELREMTAALAPSSSPGTANRLLTTSESDISVIVSLAAWFFLRRLQMICGPWRRRSGSWLEQYGAMAAYYLPTPLLVYASSAVYSSTSHSNRDVLTTYCSMCLMSSAYDPTFVMAAYTLGDGGTASSPLQRWRLLPWLLYFLWMQFDFSGKRRAELTPANLIYFYYSVVFPVLLALCVSLKKSHLAKMESETKAFADYMPLLMSKFRLSSSLLVHGVVNDDGNNNSLRQGCQDEYPFNKRKYDGTWITVKDLPRQDQDTFLSYSLCRLLARRYFRFACVEQGDAEVRNLVLTQLLSADYKRAFTIVEVQLAFLHDHFFTDYPTKLRRHNRGLVRLLVAVLIFSGLGGVAVGTLLVYHLMFFGRGHASLSPIALVPILGIVLFVALFFAVVGLLTVLPDYYLMRLPNYWRPVIRQLSIKATGTTADVNSSSTPAPTSGCHSLLRCYGRCCCRQGRRSNDKQGSCYYWRNKMGQYSLLADYDHRSLKKACVNWFEQRLLPHASPGFVKHHPTAEDDVTVPDSVRRLLALTLQQPHIMSGGLPTKGTASLCRNRDLVPGCDLLWTCEKDTSHTQIILLWHIATCYCDMFPVAAAEMEEEARDHHEVATTLSKYCAYLVAFLPQFLPEQRLTSVVELQNVLQSAKDFIGQRPAWWQRISMEEKLSRIQGLELPEDCPNRTDTDGDTTVHKGIYLGRQLMEMDDASVRWKVMAEFWTETILYVAPSDDAAAHFEHLAKGGEFVTHLWAMLSNAGILHRAADDPTPPPPPLQQQHDGVQPSSVAAARKDQRFRRCRSLPV